MAKKNTEEDIETSFQKEAEHLLKLKNPSSLRKAVRDAMKWYTGKTGVSKVNIAPIIAKKREAGAIKPGQIMTFKYESKLFGEGKLDHFDRSPLIIFLGPDESGNFKGLNLHYLPPKVRAIIMGKLLKTQGNNKMRHDIRLKIDWGMVKAISAFKPLQYAIKAYRPDHVRSKMIRIQPKEYRHIIMLPYADFVGSSARDVWRQGGF